MMLTITTILKFLIQKHFKKKLELGADLVQIYTGMIYKGPVLVKEILDP